MKGPSIMLVALCISLVCCKKKTQECAGTSVSASELSGKFVQAGYIHLDEPIRSYSSHKFDFYGDSFKMERHSILEAPSNDSCYSTRYTEYAVGSWQLNGNQIRLKGRYTNGNYEVKTDKCYQTGEFDYLCGAAKRDRAIVIIMPTKSTYASLSAGIRLYKAL